MEAIEGKLVSGLGQAAGFTQFEWVRHQLIDLVGVDPHPGTVNLLLAGRSDLARWHRWRASPGFRMDPPDTAYCSARCYPVRIAGRVPGAIVLPEIDDYPEEKLELVAALSVRRHLALDEGARLGATLCMPFPAKAVLFDIDGTLVDSMDAYLEVARVAAAPHGLSVTTEHVRHCLATGSNFWNGVVGHDRTDRETLTKALSALAAREWPRVLREHGKVFAGLAATLDELKRRGMRLGIVSGARPEVLELLRQDAVLDRFDAVVLGKDVARRKPDPEGILKCLKTLDVAPGAAAYVGDTPVDIRASRAAGTHAVGVLTGAGDSATLSECAPDRLISSHAKLVGVLEGN